MNEREIFEAGIMWARGKDTMQIAEALGYAEYVVCRHLNRIKDIAHTEKMKARHREADQ